MTDHTNDIDALLDLLAAQSRFGFHSALIALVAERDRLKRRVAELEVARVLTLSRAFQSEEALRHDRDRDLRERLVCAALTGLCADPNMNDLDIPCIAVDIADATLAAMRKGDTNGK